ncbi:hypothetical protein CHGG_03736 [Chaetomium globosum CBS 148.51]|uniref:Ion transport domain-containing protein n=1 Tax=Chaetomium globosum (strain ATCC 6205 / CBS 148.51 / DSM 1962 / NBRC 6347 / NRRL 1970) TaxID=306901 RepID=Q2H3B0_CHAGB|nr:uncharacterized protein CHGG_03736 [Chaetomium globosum CBS 148.51]EAQ87117.1 hypothetical protein CHGG_03736 [Chaetomium globosum CBS 148.51]
MGADFPDTSSHSSSDEDDDPEAALNPHGENDNVAPLFRMRRLPPQGGEDGSAVLLPGEGTVMSVYMMMHSSERPIWTTKSYDPSSTGYTIQRTPPSVSVLQSSAGIIILTVVDSAVYCLVANRVQFLRPRSDEALYQGVHESRAILCELLATRILRRFHEDHPGRSGLLLIANILVSGFDPCDTAPETVRARRPQWAIQERGGHERKLTALELAIISESKFLIKSPACQLVVDAVYKGVVVYTPLSFVDFLPDHYKYHPVSLYEPRRAAILNHHRLIVPQLRNVIELMHFGILLILYMLTVAHFGFGTDMAGVRLYETVFNVFAAGWVLEQFAAVVEHGWEVHAQNLWSFLDLTFVAIYATYGLVRAVELVLSDDAYYALPVLCTAAPVLLTRIAFALMPDNIVFIALHAMMRDFTRLTFIAIWCFAGFVVGLLFLARTSGEGSLNANVTWATVTKWLLCEKDLVWALTAQIISNEAAEVQFRRAVLTFQGVKSDAIFSYPPPFNIAAMLILLPIKFLVGPLAFHNINVAAIRTVNAPVLLLIGLWERRSVWARRSKSTRFGSWRYFPGLSPHGDIQVVFGSEPPPEVVDALEKMDALHEVGTAADRAPTIHSPKELRGLASAVRRRRTSNSSSIRRFET